MRINFVSKGGPHLASYRLRILIPAQQLAALGHEVQIGEYDRSCDVHIFSKHWDRGEVKAAHKSRCAIFDICDYHGDRGDVHEHYLDMIWGCNAVTVASPLLAEYYKLDTYTHITDPYEFPLAEPHFHPDRVKLLWFGHASNLPTLSKVDLKEKYPIEIITNLEHPGITPWSHKAMINGFKNASLTILPTSEEKPWKSPNRMVDSIRQGVFVVANDMPAYRGYEMYLGDIGEGIQWARNNPTQVMTRLKSAQQLVEKLHSPKVVGRKWLDCILAAAKNSGMDLST